MTNKPDPNRGPAATATVADHARPRPGLAAIIAANLLISAVLVYAVVLQGSNADFYYQSVQEDEYVEWATFWAFLIASGVLLFVAGRHRKISGGIPWFLVAVGLFCFVFAMEEISWGQRQIGYRPPDYFLEHNFQQEFNFHNIIETSARKLTVTAIVIGYGVLLPLMALVRTVRRRLRGVGVTTPPWPLVPSFVAAVLLYENYPWRFSGEWAELVLGFAFLFVGLAHWDEFRPVGARPPGWLQPLALAAAALLVNGLGIASAAVSRSQLSAEPEILAAAERELDALRSDFASGRVRARCNTHKRLYSFKEKYGQDYLLEGEFAGLTERGLPVSRAEFLLDQWNHPYWIRDGCVGGKRVTILYSFGPNRRRESDHGEIRGDDVGVYIRR